MMNEIKVMTVMMIVVIIMMMKILMVKNGKISYCLAHYCSAQIDQICVTKPGMIRSFNNQTM